MIRILFSTRTARARLVVKEKFLAVPSHQSERSSSAGTESPDAGRQKRTPSTPTQGAQREQGASTHAARAKHTHHHDGFCLWGLGVGLSTEVKNYKLLNVKFIIELRKEKG